MSLSLTICPECNEIITFDDNDEIIVCGVCGETCNAADFADDEDETNEAPKIIINENKIESYDSERYTLSEGILYDKDKTRVLFAEKDILKAELPEGVTKICESSFESCSKMKSIILPDSVTIIERNAFDFCASLEKIEIPPKVTVIEKDTFVCCLNLSEAVIPEGVETIKSNAFAGCSALKRIKIPDTVTLIERGAFAHCEELAEAELSKNLTEINSSTFNGDKRLESIDIPDGVTEIGAFAFSGCESLESVKIPDSVNRIYVDAFSKIPCLKEVVLPESLNTCNDEDETSLIISREAFSGSDNIEKTNINPDKLGICGFSPKAKEKIIARIETEKQRCELGVCRRCGGEFQKKGLSIKGKSMQVKLVCKKCGADKDY